MLQNPVLQPKIVVIRRRQNQGFGFTLRHFIAYPPDTSYQRKPMDTIFIKEVHTNGPADLAGLQTGDRVLMVNNLAVAGLTYNSIVSMIKQTPTVLRLQVVPKECDVLQMYYTDIAHTPESNRQTDIIRPQIPITSTTHNFHLNQRMISYSPEGSSSNGLQHNSHINQTTSFGNHDLYDSPRHVIQSNEAGFLIHPKPSNISVLHKPNNNDNSDMLVRLRKSIEQKEEFLKSPIPHSQPTFLYQNHKKQQATSSTPVLGYPITNSNLINYPASTSATTRSVNNIVKQTNDLAVSQNFFTMNNSSTNNSSKVNNFAAISKLIHTENLLNNPHIVRDTITRKQFNSINNINNCNPMNNIPPTNSTIKDQFHKELEFLESLPEMGVTNQVFERKLVSNFAKGFDPFKPLSINTGNTSNVELKAKHQINNYKLESNRKSVTAAEFEYIDFHQKHNEISRPAIDNSNLLTKPCLQAGNDDSSPENCEIDEIHTMQKTSEVIRRCKPQEIDDNKPMRRISYLRATKNGLNEYQLDLSAIATTIDSEFEPTTTVPDKISISSSSIQLDSRKSASIEKEQQLDKSNINELPEIFETEMEIKSPCIYGKRLSEFRSWRQSKIELNNCILKINPIRSSKSDNNVIELNVRNFHIIDETIDKKKFVFRLQSKPTINNELEITTVLTELGGANLPVPSTITITSTSSSSSAAATTTNAQTQSNDKNCEYTEILFKTKSITEMKKLFGLLQEKCDNQSESPGKQMAEPQKKAASTSVSTNTYCDVTASPNLQNSKDNSPLLCTKSNNELDSITTSIITSNDSISPVLKSRKSSHQKIVTTEKDLGSPKAKNWKDLLFRRIHGNSNDIPSQNPATNRQIGSIGVPLKSCPMSKVYEFVPNIVDVCTNIVETKGLNVIGIYRIPGNKAAISELKEQVNKIDFTWDKVETDDRWEDVNVVSSLLKLFIRSLPDALLPSIFYIKFIEADKKTGERRLRELKQLIHELPTHSFATMNHLIRHLSRISKNCEINLMEPKNLAIIFGPSIIRTSNETLEIAVKDMKHQCRIVELLVTQYDYFFENGALPELEPNSPPITHSSSGSHQDQTTLLLDNVSKIEQRFHDKESLTSRFIPHLRRRTHSKRSAISSDTTYSGESVLSLEYKKIPDTTIRKENSIWTNSNINKKCISIEISSGVLTDEDSSNSRVSDTGSMSLTTITDTLDSKLRSLRSGSESTDDTDSPNKSLQRRTFSPQPLVLHENIPYADESPERHLITTTTTTTTTAATATDPVGGGLHLKNLPFITTPPRNNSNFIRDITKNISLINSRFSYDESCSDDSEVSTTSDPKESLIISPLFPERYRKRRDYRLFRSASFNCRNYSSRSQNYNGNTNPNLTKDEKTDMNLTKKRQIQNKQNRSIKRRHTVGGPHDYSTSTSTVQPRRHQHNSIINDNNNGNNNHVLEVGIRIKNMTRRN